jgi:tetratricopeptide (TPR) repeat protein
MRCSKVLGFALFTALVVTSTGCTKLQSRDQMNQGVQAYKNNKYADAVKHFKEAVRLDPSNRNAQLYLATSYFVQWVPGVDSPDNVKNYSMAKQEFDKVLQEDPKDSLALASMAALAFNSAQGAGTNMDQKMAFLQDAAKWNERRIEVDPKNSEAYYYLGVIDWTKAFAPLQTERVNEHLTPDNPGPLKDAKVKADLKAKYEKDIEDGLSDLKKCLQYDKENEDAMSYMNLLLREKAYLEDSPDAAKADVAQAEDWSNKSLDMKRIKAARPAKKTET